MSAFWDFNEKKINAVLFLFGNQKKAGINHITATKNGRTVSYAVRTKISILKNHVNGLAFKDGKIIAVPQGYIKDTKEALEDYKKEYSQYSPDEKHSRAVVYGMTGIATTYSIIQFVKYLKK